MFFNTMMILHQYKIYCEYEMLPNMELRDWVKGDLIDYMVFLVSNDTT